MADGTLQPVLHPSQSNDSATARLLGMLRAITGTITPITPSDVAGRWVWGRVAGWSPGGGPGGLHIEILCTDQVVNAMVMASLTTSEMRLSSRERWQLYRTRRIETAKRLNDEAVASGSYRLLIRKDGKGTKEFQRMCYEFLSGCEIACDS